MDRDEDQDRSEHREHAGVALGPTHDDEAEQVEEREVLEDRSGELAGGERVQDGNVAHATIPVLASAEVDWPDEGRATLWLEAGATPTAPVTHTPEELERLRELGYR